ncbi:MAG: proline iminopeptidase-family hydrolase [Proteobacteria bacterium]|nr:proline iminopeptidase-family hydrolase [Pseudomonadota bacterium]
MMDDRKPDDVVKVEVDGHKVVAYSFGTGDEVLFCINGGPGLPCDYVRDAHSWLADEGYRVVAFDQLGCGASDRPDDPSLWTIERYVEETETVRKALDCGVVHLYGQSWGTWLGTEYALAYPKSFKTYTLANGACDIPHLISELHRLRAALGPETVAMMQRHEADGTIDHPEYEAAITLLNYRHVCRLDDWPAAVKRSLDDWNMGPYMAIQGPNEFIYTGSISNKNWLPEMHRIMQPSLVLCGMHDELTPACSMRIHEALANSRIKVFKNSSHLPMWEEPEAYFETLLDFLGAHRG